jgi:hypothetical protein
LGLADGIRKHGFRTHHERELLSSCGWLVLCLVAAVAAFGALEAVLQRSGWPDRLGFALAAFGCGAVVLTTLRLFLRQLARAQVAASQAVCERCGSYGRLKVVDAPRAGGWVRVGCRQCGHEWTMDDR